MRERAGRTFNVLTDDDIADIREEYDTDVELTDDLLRAVLTDDAIRLDIPWGDEWGWNDTEVATCSTTV
jgi:hypothetical protein